MVLNDMKSVESLAFMDFFIFRQIVVSNEYKDGSCLDIILR